ncbi:hypothetical protein AMTR_s02611p00002590 [Amborella trichopoda]|uniref:Uncharacterized protein n=1 Tax=Amborella trichopoda TaxID=13333 RepID=U5CYB8_AMBTC|nr:hypothetical protein AMTR_s02611p00002590 [Amborella trichopoda]
MGLKGRMKGRFILLGMKVKEGLLGVSLEERGKGKGEGTKRERVGSIPFSLGQKVFFHSILLEMKYLLGQKGRGFHSIPWDERSLLGRKGRTKVPFSPWGLLEQKGERGGDERGEREFHSILFGIKFHSILFRMK